MPEPLPAGDTEERDGAYLSPPVQRAARLLRTVRGDDLFFAALGGHEVHLTLIGRLYWRLASQERI